MSFSSWASAKWCVAAVWSAVWRRTLRLYPELMEKIGKVGGWCLSWAPTSRPPIHPLTSIIIFLTVKLSSLLLKKAEHRTAPQTYCTPTPFCGLFVWPFLRPSALRLCTCKSNLLPKAVLHSSSSLKGPSVPQAKSHLPYTSEFVDPQSLSNITGSFP